MGDVDSLTGNEEQAVAARWNRYRLCETIVLFKRKHRRTRGAARVKTSLGAGRLEEEEEEEEEREKKERERGGRNKKEEGEEKSIGRTENEAQNAISRATG